MQIQTRQIGIFAALAVLMLFTRGSHFGSTINLPDATLAIFLIAGFMLPSFTLAALAVFTLFLLEAGGIDYYAIAYNGVNDYCVSPAYWFLIPTYASMWLAGHWFAKHNRNSPQSLALFGSMSLAATSVAFLISNGAFYAFSGKFGEMNAAEYASRVAQYYPPYVSGALMYLALAAIIYLAVTLTHKSVSGSTQH